MSLPKKLLVGLLCSTMIHYAAFASASHTNATTAQHPSATVQALEDQAATLEKQLIQLQQQITALEKQQATPTMVSNQQYTQPHQAPTGKKLTSDHAQTSNTTYPALPYRGLTSLGNIGGTAVITSPFIHSESPYDGSDLIVNYSSIEKDVAVLKQRQNFEKQMQASGLDLPKDPLVELSGEVGVEAFHNRAFSGSNDSDFNLTDAELDIQIHANKWINGFMSIVYDDGAPEFGNRVNNSNIFLDNGFVTIGNFNETPFYATAGQLYVPFGAYSSNLISDPFNKIIFRTKGRPIVLGYHTTEKTGPYASVYGFKGDIRTGELIPDATSRSPSSTINTYGADAGYKFNLGELETDIAVSYISNIADAEGMQSTSASSNRFEGFGTNSTTQVLLDRVAGYDARATFSYKQYSLITEYSSAVQDFNRQDMSFNSHGAQPSAYHIEGVYNFDILSYPSTFVLAYDKSAEALALNVPEKGYSIGLNASIWRHTLESLEFHHYQNYGRHDTASGINTVVFGAPGQVSNALIAKIDVYF